MTDAPAPGIDAGSAIGAVLTSFTAARIANERLVVAVAVHHGIGPSDVRAVSYIGGVEGSTPKQVASYLGLTTGAMTTLLDRLDAAGLVRRVAHPQDRRSVQLVVTEAGARMVAELHALYQAAFAAGLRDADPLQTAADLSSIAGALQRAAVELAGGEIDAVGV